MLTSRCGGALSLCYCDTNIKSPRISPPRLDIGVHQIEHSNAALGAPITDVIVTEAVAAASSKMRRTTHGEEMTPPGIEG
jgi:hypothetical protein